jgi:acyl-coenzyme A synthetase/AMP-(fatty) acid ligase
MYEYGAACGAQHVLRWAQAKPQALAVVMGEAQLTYAEVARQLANAVKAVEARGVGAGMTVGVECDSPYLRVLVMLACEVLGAVHVPFSAVELQQADGSAARCGFFLAEHPGPALAATAPVARIDREFVSRLGGPATAEDLARLDARSAPDAGVRIAKTSGTTGAAKLMLRTRRMVDAAIASYDVALRPVAGDYAYVCAYSPAIGGVYTDIVRALRFGNRICFVADVAEFIAACGAGHAYAYLLPREAEALAETCRAAAIRLDMYYVDITGSGVSPALDAALREWVSPWVANVYSSNETGPIAYWEGGDRYAVVPGVEVRIVDETWRPAPAGEPGRICVRSPIVVSGYLDDPALSAAHFRDGWFLTSDLGLAPRPGLLRVLGRADDMLNIGGVKIPPYPIEQALRSIPGVTDAALLRIESKAAVGSICAVVEASSADEAALARQAARIVAQHVRSFTVRVEGAFPRTPTGKVRRDVLLARALADRSERPPVTAARAGEPA